MTAQLTLLDSQTLDFPPQHLALNEPNGLLAIGGDLSTQRLKLAYKNGIFPWYNEGEPIMWWCPKERAILPINAIKISRSLKKLARQRKYTITLNQCFSKVIGACIAQRVDQEGTWITSDMQSAYNALHAAGVAHSIEVFNKSHQLVGGLYGVATGNVFCGESMFHRESNCSKLAFWALHNFLRQHQFQLIDCQIENPHLASLGSIVVPRDVFLTKLIKGSCIYHDKSIWQAKELTAIYD